jgi:hypothetical protein
MLNLHPLLAAAATEPNPSDALKNTGSPNFLREHNEMFIILGVVLVLGILLFLVVYIARGGKSRRSSSRTRVLYQEKQKSEEDARRYRKRKRRANHPDNLPRNPTLGETGGLPPLRPEEPSEPLS